MLIQVSKLLNKVSNQHFQVNIFELMISLLTWISLSCSACLVHFIWWCPDPTCTPLFLQINKILSEDSSSSRCEGRARRRRKGNHVRPTRAVLSLRGLLISPSESHFHCRASVLWVFEIKYAMMGFTASQHYLLAASSLESTECRLTRACSCSRFRFFFYSSQEYFAEWFCRKCDRKICQECDEGHSQLIIQ